MSRFFIEIKNLIENLEKQVADKDREIARIKKNWNNSRTQQRRLYDNLKQELIVTQKALQLAREYMLKVMCADDVPSEEWFIKCAKGIMKSE